MAEEKLEETSSEPVEVSRREPWLVEDFIPAFCAVGLTNEDDRWVHRDTIQTGRMVVNGAEKVMTDTLEISFRFLPDFVATIDDSYLAGIDVEIIRSSQKLLSETIYCEPSGFEGFYRFYLNGK